MFPDVFQHSIHIPARLSSESGLFQDLSTISPSLDPACSEGLMLLVCHYLHPSCTENGRERFIITCSCRISFIHAIYLYTH